MATDAFDALEAAGCESKKDDADCQALFRKLQSLHDYCPHDTLTRYEEELFHE